MFLKIEQNGRNRRLKKIISFDFVAQNRFSSILRSFCPALSKDMVVLVIA
jgi:hypothetical protein